MMGMTKLQELAYQVMFVLAKKLKKNEKKEIMHRNLNNNILGDVLTGIADSLGISTRLQRVMFIVF